MDWRSVNFDWNRARAFLVTAEEGSLSAAARALGLTQPTLGRQVNALEKELGVDLFERMGRRLTLTPNGQDLLSHVRAMGHAAGQMSLAASGRSQTIEGDVCISASEIHAALLLPPVVAKLRWHQPGIAIEIVASNEASDLQRREADIAIRSFRPVQKELIARKLRDVGATFYATPDYIAHIGQPRSLEDLKRAMFVTIGGLEQYMKELGQFGLELSAQNFPVRSANHIVHWELVKQGIGIGIVPVDIGDAEPLVRRVLPGYTLATFPIWLTTHREIRTSKRIRLVFDFLAQELGSL